MRTLKCALLAVCVTAPAQAEIHARAVAADVSRAEPAAAWWTTAPVETVSLMAQPMVTPRPKETLTPHVAVQAATDGKWIAFRFHWSDPEKSEAGRLGEFSDGCAMMFPVLSNDAPPPIFMGAKDNPVHIFHWRAQYQRDRDHGKPTIRDLYPNVSIDIYPGEFADQGSIGVIPPEKREQFSPGMAEGNPQSYAKTGVDEIYAEGFSTSQVQAGGGSWGMGVWENGAWTVVIARELKREGGSVLTAPGKTFAGFAVWQGGSGEVGSRKDVTMVWTPVVIDAAPLGASR